MKNFYFHLRHNDLSLKQNERRTFHRIIQLKKR